MGTHVMWGRLVAVGLALLGVAAAPPVPRLDAYGDPLPRGAVARLGTVRFRQRMDHGPAQLAYSPDGKTLLAVGHDGMRLWDVASGLPVARPVGTWDVKAAHWAGANGVVTLRFYADRDDTGNTSWSVWRRQWDDNGNRVSRDLIHSEYLAKESRAVLLARDGSVVVTVGVDLKLSVWDGRTGKLLHTLAREASDPWAAVLTADGKQVIYGTKDGGLVVGETATGKLLRTLAEGRPAYTRPVLADDERTLAVSCSGDLEVWDVPTGKRLASATGAAGVACFSPNGKLLASAGSGVRLFDARSLRLVRTLDGVGPAGGVRALAFSPDGTTLAVGEAGAISFWDVATSRRRGPPTGHRAAVADLAFTADGSRLVSGDAGGTAIVWDTATGLATRYVAGERACDTSLAVSADGRWLATADSPYLWAADRRWAEVRVYDLATTAAPRRFPAHLASVHAMLLSPDGKLLATCGKSDHSVRLWDTTTGRRRQAIDDVGLGRPLAFVAGGTRLLVEDWVTGAYHLLDATGPRVETVPGPARPGWRVAGVSRGEQVVEVAYDTVTWKALPDWKPMLTKPSPVDPVVVHGRRYPLTLVCMSTDGTMLAYRRERGQSVYVVDLLTGAWITTIEGMPVAAEKAAFSPDGSRLAIDNGDTTILLWDVEGPRYRSAIELLLAGRGEAHHLAVAGRRGFGDLTARLLAGTRVPPEVSALLRALDADTRAERDLAADALAKLGGDAAFALKVAVASLSAEVRARARHLLAKLPPEVVQQTLDPTHVEKVVRLLGELGTPAARATLEELVRADSVGFVGTAAGKALAERRPTPTRP